MNYPIYNEDHSYTCEEIFRYLQEFPHHIVYVSRPFQLKKQKEMRSTHVYPRDGLSIELRWQYDSAWIPSKLSAMRKLLKMQEEGLIQLIDFRIIQFSANHTLSQQSLLDAKVRNTYYERVLQSGAEQYGRKEYKWLEWEISEPGRIPDVFFDWLIGEVANVIEFEEYYHSIKKSRE